MPRVPADFRISWKRRGGKTHRIELVRQANGLRFAVRRDGKRSRDLPVATASQVAQRIRRWLAAGS